MGVPTSEVCYTCAMPRREDNEVNKRTCGGIGGKKILISNFPCYYVTNILLMLLLIGTTIVLQSVKISFNLEISQLWEKQIIT